MLSRGFAWFVFSPARSYYLCRPRQRRHEVFWWAQTKVSYHSVSKALGMRALSAPSLMKQPTPCPPPVRFRYQLTPGGNMSQHVPPYGHKVGFVCMGGTPSAAWLAQTPKLGGTPCTYKTNPVVIRGNMRAYITPRGRLIPKPHPGGGQGGGCFTSLCGGRKQEILVVKQAG